MGRADVKANRVRSYRKRLSEAVAAKFETDCLKELALEGRVIETADPERDKVLV